MPPLSPDGLLICTGSARAKCAGGVAPSPPPEVLLALGGPRVAACCSPALFFPAKPETLPAGAFDI